MRYLLSDAPQGSDEWKQARAGKATGSRSDAILAIIKSGEAAARRDYRVQLVTERLTNAPAEDGFVSKDMQWGTDQEPFARMAFEALTGNVVAEAGFAYLPDIQAGCSVDGFVHEGDKTGILECKCPKSATHIKYLQAGVLPSDYLAQVTHNAWITGADFVDFVSFDPRFPANLQLFHVRVPVAMLSIETHEKEVLKFLAEVDELEASLRRRTA
jgi:predicted phage-related endonuclease